MFSSSNKKLKEIKTTNVSTIIGDGTVIHGDIVFSGGLHIDGKVVGNVSAELGSETLLTLSKRGAIHGNVDVPTIVIDGEVKGDVCGVERVQLVENARVTGNVTYNLIEMSVGAEVNGQLLRYRSESESVSKLEKPETPPDELF